MLRSTTALFKHFPARDPLIVLYKYYSSLDLIINSTDPLGTDLFHERNPAIQMLS